YTLKVALNSVSVISCQTLPGPPIDFRTSTMKSLSVIGCSARIVPAAPHVRAIVLLHKARLAAKAAGYGKSRCRRPASDDDGRAVRDRGVIRGKERGRRAEAEAPAENWAGGPGGGLVGSPGSRRSTLWSSRFTALAESPR